MLVFRALIKSGVLLVGGLLAFALGLGCASQQSSQNTYKDSTDQPLVEDKYRITEDRKKLDELRQEVPQEIKTENDELALVSRLLSENQKSPSEIRNKFDSLLRKKREVFNKDLKKERETFTKQERKNRESFLKESKKSRDLFLKSKPDRDQRAEFFKNQDEQRREYFGNERDRRSDFESDVRERRKNFDDYVRGRQTEFYQEWRAYSRRHDDNKRKEREAKREKAALANPQATKNPAVNSEVRSFLQELQEAQGLPSENLESGQ